MLSDCIKAEAADSTGNCQQAHPTDFVSAVANASYLSERQNYI